VPGSEPVDRAARRLAFAYLVVAGLWILLSDSLFALFGDPFGYLGDLLKGLVFVAATAWGLYVTVRAMYRRQHELDVELARQSQIQATLFNRSPESMWVYEPDTLRLLEVNDTMVRRYGRSRDELLGLHTTDLGPNHGIETVIRRGGGPEAALEPHLVLHYGPFGDQRWVEVVAHPVEWNGGTAMLAIGRDVTAQKRTEDALRQSEHRLAGVLASMQEMAFSIDLVSGRISYLNDVAAEILGQHAAQVLISLDQFNALVVDDDREIYRDAMRRVVTEGWVDAEFRIRRPDGEVRTLQARARGVKGPSGRVDQVDGVAVDLTHRQELASLLEHQQSFDFLTGLPNRLAFVAEVDAALAEHEGELPGVLALFDLDRFASINQSAGHFAGDSILATVADRVTAMLSPGMLAARVGGDEFAVYCPPGLATADELGALLQAAVDVEISVGDYEFYVSMSIGVTEAPAGSDAEDLLRDAHLAMTAAKQRTAGIEHFHPTYRSAITEQVKIEHDLRRALSDGELVAAYQPQVSLRTDRVVGVEALVRWHHPERGLVPAASFVPAAERTSMIGEIGQLMLGLSCAQARAWRARYGDLAPRIWVNLSRRELDSPHIATRILRALADHELPGEAIGVEVTETAFVAEGGPGLDALRQLADGGVAIALDDFGTGWSSLQTLKAFPLSAVKIDRSFVTNVGVSIDDTQIVQAVIGMGTGMSLVVVAEGVETAEQLNQLRRMGCDEVQGYLLGRPGPPEKIEEILDMGGKPTVFTS
jgi:diguanylate cyclase (GGDEF)-like protein/PAS domain S-box-containing protein